MISVIPTYNNNFRAFGWVQDPSNLRSLCNVVAIFDSNSEKHKELLNKTVSQLVLEEDGRADLIAALKAKPLKIKFSHLTGTAFYPRSQSRCNGIVQAAVKGQSRPFIGDWPADNFVRWAHCFGFIKYDYKTDAFEITPSGLELCKANSGEADLSLCEKKLLINAALAYPPVIRILTLLSPENAHLTKFEIGRQLGFVGEAGFTSMPQNPFIRALSGAESAKEKNAMKADWEGSSDKYARMISKWLEKLGLVEQIAKTVTVRVGNSEYSESIGQSYMITAQGITALNKALGKSRHARISKNIFYEMLATKNSDREFLRTRRALIIKQLSESKKEVAADAIVSYLDTQNISATPGTVCDDVQGLINMGLDIKINGNYFKWNDVINDFVIPLPQKLAKSQLEYFKDKIRKDLENLSHEYLALIDLSYDSKQNRLFEMKTIELLTEECGYNGLHLGGSRRPDGIIYTTELTDNYGVIIDTKAYSGGYNLPISQADEMERYIRENQSRDATINSNKWWKNFDESICQFYFMFVSGHFIGNYKSQLKRLMNSTKTNGAAVRIGELLVCAEKIKANESDLKKIADNYFSGNFDVKGT